MNGKKAVPCGPKSPSTVVAGKKRIRNTLLHVWLSPDERAKIQERMEDAGIRNLSAYIRKMALNGYVLHVDLTPVKEIVSIQRRCANNLNQIAVQANTNGGFGVQPQQAFSQGENGECIDTRPACQECVPWKCFDLVRTI